MTDLKLSRHDERLRSRGGRSLWRLPRWPAAALVATALWLGANQAATETMGGDHRLVYGFVGDGAIIQEGWIELAGDYEDHDGGDDFRARITASFRFGRDVEAGIISGVMVRQRASGEELFGARLSNRVSGAGLFDPLIYGKYRITRGTIDLSVGAAAEIPLADDEAGRGPGILQYGAFVGLRRSFSRSTFIWSLGLSDRGDADLPEPSEGEAAMQLGTGVLVPLSRIWMFIGEASYESARFKGESAEARVLLGLDWRPARNLVMRGGVSGGLTERAPDIAATISVAIHF